ncbi:MAG TPA: hypothetical protein VN372_12995 [Methanospirillum sp.]|nr:hypothetical protein [Methanospirillum sp.]
MFNSTSLIITVVMIGGAVILLSREGSGYAFIIPVIAFALVGIVVFFMGRTHSRARQNIREYRRKPRN